MCQSIESEGPCWGVSMSHVSVAYFPQCLMSNLRNNHVVCHYLSYLHVPCGQGSCRMSVLRKANVAVSNIRVEGHSLSIGSTGHR